MSYVRRVLLLLGLLAIAGAAASAASAEPAGRGRPEIVGTYHRMAKDVVEPDGSLRDVYQDHLVSGTRSYRLHLPRGVRLQPGATVRAVGTVAGQDMTADDVETLAPAPATTATGTTKVLVVLVHWSSPDGMTTAQAASQVFGDDHGWFGEASYGQLGLTGDVTGWHQITPPTGGMCYSRYREIMDRAKAQAMTAGYDYRTYGRTIVYFPSCGADAAGAAGWAMMPGTEVWLNGYFDRRVSVHEQGHNYGLAHAHTYNCLDSAGLRITLGTVDQCDYVDYGDDYDAMGASSYAAHYSAPAKSKLGWLTSRTRSLTGEPATFTLPPYEVAGATPLAAVVGAGADRQYWVEYRRPVGYDSALPTGATGGVLVHMKDPTVPGDGGAHLLDVTPGDEYGEAVIPPGGAWTSPEGVRIAVGTVTASGAEVTVSGGAAPPVVPSVPRNLEASAGDESVDLTWDPPASNGGATVTSYVVTATPGGIVQTFPGTETAATVDNLTNGVTYTFTVAARNAAGTGPATAGVTAVPTAQVPSALITSPAAGATITGVQAVTVTATPNPITQSPVEFVELYVDGEPVDWDSDAPFEFSLNSRSYDDGQYTLTAVAYDADWRNGTSPPVTVTMHTPRPTVTITTPANGAVIMGDSVRFEATAAPAPGGAPLQWVYYELLDGTDVAFGGSTAPFTGVWDATAYNGGYDVVAKVVDQAGFVGTSAPIHVTLDHAVPTVAMTAPAHGATVSGRNVLLTATAAPSPLSDAPVERVEFYVDQWTLVGTDYEAPYEAEWDTGALTGSHLLSATAYDTDGKSATTPVRSVTVDNPVPSVVVTSPAPDEVVSGQVTLTAVPTASEESGEPIARVVFTVDGWNTVATVEAPGPYTTTWNSAGQPGEHTVVATAYDEAGRAGESAPVTFVVPPPAPSVAITSPAGGSVRSGAVTITAAASPDVHTGAAVAGVQFFVDDEVAGWDDTPADGFSTTWTATPGAHVLYAVAYDDQTYSGRSSDVALTVADPPGAPTGVVATAGPNGTATVSWTAPASDGGSPVGGYVVKTGTATQVAASSPYVFTGLANGTAYAFSVAATNVAGTGAYSAPSAAVTPGTRTTLAITGFTPSTVTYGKAVTVTGVLKRSDGVALTGQSVQLLACAPRVACTSVAKAAKTVTGGKVTFTYVPPAHRDLRLRFLTAGQYLASQTAAKRVSVRTLVTSAISKTSMPLGAGATVSGKVSPAHAGQRVYLQTLTSTGWKSGPYKTLGSTGTAAFAVKPAKKGTYSYRLYFAGDADHLAGTSPARSVRVY